MRLNSIRARMTAAFVLAIVAVLLVVCSGILWYAKHAAERNADTVMKAMAERMQHDLEIEGAQAGLADEIQDMKTDNLALVIVNAKGQAIRQSAGDVPTWPRRADDGWRVITARSGPNTLVIGQPWKKTADVLRNLAMALLFVSLCVILAAGVGAWLLVGRTLSPIGALSREAQAASSESLHIRLNAPSQDAEVVQLVTTLNGLLTRLSETAASKGRFYAAASHELRTPLQVFSGYLEMALTRERTAPEYRAALDEAYQQAQRLVSLVHDLLLLNQLDSAPAPPPAEPINLTDICERALDHYRPLVEQNLLQVQSGLRADVEIHAPLSHVNMLVRNLIENAIKYATPGGAVCIDLAETSAGTRLELFNECRPLAPEVVEHLFEPFYRPDASRNSETGGNGLGLAICKAITVCNGWRLTLQPDAEGMRTVVVFAREKNPSS